MKKEDQRPITYLNRGQTYLLELSSTSQQRGTLTSTISIAFHESSHRKIAASYWRFWLSQQLNPEEARAVSLDENQTTGIYNINYVSFDKVTFDWHGRFGAKIYVRFHCLSTDFSRIKGVKGIPLRAVVETTAKYNQLPDSPSLFSGTFSKKDNSTNPYMHLEDQYEYVERCYCQIKLFRDKVSILFFKSIQTRNLICFHITRELNVKIKMIANKLISKWKKQLVKKSFY